MPSNLSRRIPGVGQTWLNGQMVKARQINPIPTVYAKNLKRLILENQATIFNPIEQLEGVTLFREGADFVKDTSIHLGLLKQDPNKISIYIVTKYSYGHLAKNAGRNDKITFEVYIKSGAGGTAQYERAGIYAIGIANLIDACDIQELVFGWPVNITTEEARKRFQPVLILEYPIIVENDVTNGELTSQFGALASVSFSVQINTKLSGG